MPTCPHSHGVGLKRWQLILLLSFLFFQTALAQDSTRGAAGTTDSDVGYQLSVVNQRITLEARQASLKSILESIAQKMDVDAVIRISRDDKITIEIKDLTLEEALKAFGVNYAMVSNTKDKDGPVNQLVVVPQGQSAQLAARTSHPSAGTSQDIPPTPEAKEEKRTGPQPFKFEFDPSSVIKQPK